jgi:uncharacterized cupredoxin-like copper-binding protein
VRRDPLPVRPVVCGWRLAVRVRTTRPRRPPADAAFALEVRTMFAHVTRRWPILLLAAFTVGGVACAGNASEGSNEPGAGGNGGSTTPATASASGGEEASERTVDVTEKDFAIGAASSEIDAGTVTFDITNRGPSIHEFVVLRTDDEASKLPTTKDENGIPIVDEDAKSLHPVDEQEDIAAGSTTSLTVDLKPGRYVAICNLPGHYQQGMYASFTVS